jgi:Protein of unknown function with PCYCGC motif
MRFTIALLLGLFVALGVGLFFHQRSNQKVSVTASHTNHVTTAPGSKISASRTETHQHQVMDRVPAYYRLAPNTKLLPPTMRPEIFEGNVRRAYQVAKEIPQTLAQLPCYCHCDVGQGHKSLHSCFVDEHGANCGTCVNEALMAYRLEKGQKLSARQIRERIIADYGKRTTP